MGCRVLSTVEHAAFHHVHVPVVCLCVLCRGLPTSKCKPRMNWGGVFCIYKNVICSDTHMNVYMHIRDRDDVFSHLYKCVGVGRQPKCIERMCECVCMRICMSRWPFMNLNVFVNIYIMNSCMCTGMCVYICEHMRLFNVWGHVYAKCVNVCVHWVYKFACTCARTYMCKCAFVFPRIFTCLYMKVSIYAIYFHTKCILIM